MIVFKDLCFTVDCCFLVFGRAALNFSLLTLHCISIKQNCADPNRDESLQHGNIKNIGSVLDTQKQ